MQTKHDGPEIVAQRGRTWARIARVLKLLLLVLCATAAVREEIAAWYAHGRALEGYRKAESWDAANPAYPAAIARMMGAHLETADARSMAREFETATRVGPQRAFEWANLAGAYEASGRIADAERAYDRALEIFPKSPEINWQYANHLVRAGYLTAAIHPLREAILGDARLRIGAFDLAWRAGEESGQILQMIPDRQDILSAYLDYLVRTGRLDAAGPVWQRLVASPEEFDFDAAFRFFDALRDAHRVDEMEGLWRDLARHDPAKFRWDEANPNRITNGSFEEPILNGGFGWRIATTEGAAIRLDTTASHEGIRSLEIQFQGTENLEFGNVVQYVAVEPDTAYAFRAFARREGITTDSGPRIAIYDPYDRDALSAKTENLLGTAGWEEQALEFRTGPRTRLIVVQIARRASKKLDNRIAGTLWLDDFSLTAAQR